MASAILDTQCSVFRELRSMHRLQREAFKCKILEALRWRALLGKHKLQLVAGSNTKLSTGFWADTNPVEAWRRVNRSIGFDGDLKAACVQCTDQRGINLQQRLAPGQDHKPPFTSLAPDPLDDISQAVRGFETAAIRAVCPYELGIAELALRGLTVGLATGPEIAARKAAKHRCAASMRALALQGQKDFLDCVCHVKTREPKLTALAAPG